MPALRKVLNRLEFYRYRVFSKLFSYKTIRVKGRSFNLKTGTENETHRAFTFHTKEPETLAWIDSFPEASGSSEFVFFDIGANIGIYSLYASARYPYSTVFAFEPDAQSFASLCQNIHANKFKIFPFSFAISDASGVGKVTNQFIS